MTEQKQREISFLILGSGEWAERIKEKVIETSARACNFKAFIVGTISNETCLDACLDDSKVDIVITEVKGLIDSALLYGVITILKNQKITNYIVITVDPDRPDVNLEGLQSAATLKGSKSTFTLLQKNLNQTLEEIRLRGVIMNIIETEDAV